MTGELRLSGRQKSIGLEPLKIPLSGMSGGDRLTAEAVGADRIPCDHRRWPRSCEAIVVELWVSIGAGGGTTGHTQ